MAAEEPRGIMRLSNELLKEILDHLARDPEKCVSVDNRASLSIESFSRPSAPDPPALIRDGKNGFREDHRSDLDRFREVCRRFADVGAAHKFSRVVVRFSVPAFHKLDKLSGCPHLARHVKSFTYIIRSFYDEERANIQQLFSTANSTKLDVGTHLRRLEEQKKLVRSGDDMASLRRAMAAFTTLQHVKILRVQDEAERELQSFIERHDNPLDPLVVLSWKPACVRAIQTLGTALLESGSPINRFSGPQMNAQAALSLRYTPQPVVSELARKLTCLEIHFDAARHVNAEMRELSDVFHNLFTSARNMEAVHLGFPSRLPLDLRLEDVFHNVHWTRLRAFGIQAWRLDADEIINFASRHRRTLRGLRLRDVLLKEGSMWKDVLAFLHDEMENLEWVSLRRIDYSNAFDEKWAASADILDIPSFPNSDSEEEEEDDEDDDDGDNLFDNGDDGAVGDSDDVDSSIGSESDGLSSHNGDHGPRANQIELSPDTTVTAPSLLLPFAGYRREPLAAATVDDLGDDGTNVDYRQRKLWEQWVVSRPKPKNRRPEYL
ncbi:hypothetical protein VTO42DRAFT_4971 [Malbranchea cinnamomea]